MSSRKSNSNGEGLPSPVSGLRTPLRSVQNEMVPVSTPSSKLKLTSLATGDVRKITKDENCVYNPVCNLPCSAPAEVIEPSGKALTCDDVTEITRGLEDVTFKSFICTGGEIEISEPSMVAEETIILPKLRDSICQRENTCISDSMINQSCSDHVEHPYCVAEQDSANTSIGTISLSELSHTRLVADDMDNDTKGIQESITFQVAGNGHEVTFKSFSCDGGEVEVSDVTRASDETIPLPSEKLWSHLTDASVNPSIIQDDYDQQFHQEHTDHPYYSNETDPASSSSQFSVTSEISHGMENSVRGQNDITFKSFVCPGGEVEVSDATRIADQTIPLLTNQVVSIHPCGDSVNADSVVGHSNLQPCCDHAEHPYCNVETDTSASGDVSSPCELLPQSLEVLNEEENTHPSTISNANRQTDVTYRSFFCTGGEVEVNDSTKLLEQSIPLPKDQSVTCQLPSDDSVHASVIQGEIQYHSEHPYFHVECDRAVSGIEQPAVDEPSIIDTTPVKLVEDVHAHYEDVNEVPKMGSLLAEENMICSALQDPSAFTYNELEALDCSMPVEVQEEPECKSSMQSRNGAQESSEAKDSALGSTSNGPIPSSPSMHAEKLSDVLTDLPDLSPLLNTVQFELFSPVVKATPIARVRVRRESALARVLAEDCALEGEKSWVAALKPETNPPCFGPLESPMPRPLLSSTFLGARSTCKVQPAQAKETVVVNEKPCVAAEPEVLDIPLIPDGPLQQQLRQMAEFLMMASGKVGATLYPPHTAATTSASTTPKECHSVSVGTTPLKLVHHSMNTSGQFERKREFSVADACTNTSTWNVPPGSLESLSRLELEERLRTSMIMVEVLVQQLAAARQQGSSAAGPPPSELRDRLVQTDHTELDQTSTYRDLYVTALDRISELELDQRSLQEMIQCMQDTKTTMTALTLDTASALSSMKQMVDTVRDDQDSLVTQYGQMKCVYEKFQDIQSRMLQKVKGALQHREDMRQQMEEAFTAKEAAIAVTRQLRTHCAERISELEESVGSHQELMAALTTTYPEQVALNKAYVETLNSTSELLTRTMSDHASLDADLRAARALLDRTCPILFQLNQKADEALRERDQHLADRDQAVEERDQIQEELNQANLELEDARQQIRDLNLQMTILNSEMGVCREKLNEGEEERAQLERKVTELSATVSSTLASYTFLEQSLDSETTKLQQSWKDVKQANHRADELQASLGQSEQCVSELSQSLALAEGQLSQLQAHSHAQSLQIVKLQELCSQLSSMKEMNEFLQMENELAREQMTESESMLRANLQGLRERNIQCEDLKEALKKFQAEKEGLEAQLEATRARAHAVELDMGEQLSQAVTDVTLLHHTLQGLTKELQAALSDKKTEPTEEKGTQPSLSLDLRQRTTSFVDSIMVALSADTDTEAPTGPDVAEQQCEGLLSETSAFTRIAPITPKRTEAEEPEQSGLEEEHSSVVELLADLGNTVSELASTLTLVQQRKDTQLEELRNTVFRLQGEQQDQASRHRAEVLELKKQMSQVDSLVEKGNLAMQQQVQDEKTMTKLLTEFEEARELLGKCKAENTELRQELAELQCSVHQSQVEAQALREELSKASGQLTNPMQLVEEKIHLLREVERLKGSMQKLEQAKAKLLERAKKHQIIHQLNEQKMENEMRVLDNIIDKVRTTFLSMPEVVNSCEQLKQLADYIG